MGGRHFSLRFWRRTHGKQKRFVIIGIYFGVRFFESDRENQGIEGEIQGEQLDS
jgi:hypothetical protein